MKFDLKITQSELNISSEIVNGKSLNFVVDFQTWIKGEPGKDEEKGEKGDDGPQGLQGAQGIPGTDGKNGEPGRDGINGAPGTNGKNGTPGEDGKSAYHLAVEVGYKGSASQFAAEQSAIVNNSARLTLVENNKVGKVIPTKVDNIPTLTSDGSLKDSLVNISTFYEDTLAYGIEWDITISSPNCTRIGNMNLHRTLPVQSKMRGCLLADDGTVNEYLPEDNWIGSVLDGSRGQVMVELPLHYRKFVTDGTKRQAWISLAPINGYHTVEQCYVSAYEATVERSTLKFSSVVNYSPDYRGGGNQANWDALSKTQLGRPATNISLTNFRTYARNRGSAEWNCNTYQIHRTLYWLFVVEYANFNSQDTFNSKLTPDGYRQGGLGAGVTTLNATSWNNFNEQCSFVPCGHTNSLGNRTGNVDFTMPVEYGILTVQVPSYRGFENPFGHLFKWTDGCKCMIQSDTDGGLSEFYVCDSPANFTSSGTTNYELRGVLPRANGYVKEVILGEYGEIMPLMVGAGTTTYFCDYFYTSNPASEVSERIVALGGSAFNGTNSGFACNDILRTDRYQHFSVGSRLCFIPNK